MREHDNEETIQIQIRIYHALLRIIERLEDMATQADVQALADSLSSATQSIRDDIAQIQANPSVDLAPVQAAVTSLSDAVTALKDALAPPAPLPAPVG